MIDHRELAASLQLLLLSLVIPPYLPNTGLGPYAALNPYQLWRAAILIAGLSLSGHFAMRITGAQSGVLWTAILGVLASAAAAGSPAACGVMFFRMAVLLAALQPSLLSTFGSSLVGHACGAAGCGTLAVAQEGAYISQGRACQRDGAL